jgi:hypothetical protein
MMRPLGFVTGRHCPPGSRFGRELRIRTLSGFAGAKLQSNQLYHMANWDAHPPARAALIILPVSLSAAFALEHPDAVPGIGINDNSDNFLRLTA